MTTWTVEELAKVEAAHELECASLRRDGTLRDPVTIWVVRAGDDLYVRSVKGPSGSWFRGSQVLHEGHIKAGGVERDVTFVEVDHDLDNEIDDAYRTKYSYSESAVSHITSPEARSTTLKLLPRSAPS